MARRWVEAGLAALLSTSGCGDDGGAAQSSGESGSTSSADGSTSTTSSSTESSTTGDSTGQPLEGYDDPALWLCHPDKPAGTDQCLANDLSATEILPDGSTQLVTHTPADDPAFDCFYVYPTVDIRFTVGQTEDFDDISQELDPLLSQAARFSSMCRVFAPLYHQITIGTFGSSEQDVLLDAAYADIEAAFQSYLEHHGGDRNFVIMGHSQGTYMTTRLLQEIVEPDEALRSRLVVALLIGGSVSVPFDETVGGTFSQLPLCTTPEQTGCVIAYRTYADTLPPEPGAQSPDAPGLDVACTNPGDLSNAGPARLRGAYFPTFTAQETVFPLIDFGMPIDTPFVLMSDFYRSECRADADGLGYLAVWPDPDPGDVRTDPIDVNNPLFNPGFLGLHVLDYNYPQTELLELVELKAAAI